LSDRNEEVTREQKCLKQKCTEAIRQWDISMKDNKNIHQELNKVVLTRTYETYENV